MGRITDETLCNVRAPDVWTPEEARRVMDELYSKPVFGFCPDGRPCWTRAEEDLFADAIFRIPEWKDGPDAEPEAFLS